MIEAELVTMATAEKLTTVIRLLPRLIRQMLEKKSGANRTQKREHLTAQCVLFSEQCGRLTDKCIQLQADRGIHS